MCGDSCTPTRQRRRTLLGVTKVLIADGDEIEVRLIAGFLESQGIAALVEGEASGSWPVSGRFPLKARVLVAEQDAERARQVLADVGRDGSAGRG